MLVKEITYQKRLKNKFITDLNDDIGVSLLRSFFVLKARINSHF